MIENKEWHKQALCANEDPELWFYEPISGSGIDAKLRLQIKTAKSICSDCPVKNLCLEQGLEAENMIIGTIWGGFLWQERKLMRKKTKAA